MDFFSNQAGRTVVIPDGGLPLALSFDRWPGARTAKACVNGMTAGAAVNVQFMHTLKNVIHFDVFGDRVSDMQLSLLAFSGMCGSNTNDTGVDNVWNYYLKNKASVLGSLLSISVGARLRFSGLLVGLQMGLNDSVSGISQFNLQFRYNPPEPFN